MNIDWSVKVTDLIMIGVAFLGPIAAVQISEFLRSKADAKNRRVHIFRTLMATRSATLLGTHIEAINLVADAHLLGEGRHEVEVSGDLPEGIAVLETKPKKVTVTLVKRNE